MSLSDIQDGSNSISILNWNSNCVSAISLKLCMNGLEQVVIFQLKFYWGRLYEYSVHGPNKCLCIFQDKIQDGHEDVKNSDEWSF